MLLKKTLHLKTALSPHLLSLATTSPHRVPGLPNDRFQSIMLILISPIDRPLSKKCPNHSRRRMLLMYVI